MHRIFSALLPTDPPPATCRARPADAPGISKDEWFNVFVLHQNRVAHTQVVRGRVPD